MKLTRRDLLLRASAAVLVVPACRREPGAADETDRTETDAPEDTGWSWEPGPEPATAWDPGGDADAGLAWGVQVGDVTETAAIVSVQTDAEAVTVRVARGTDAGWEDIAATDALAPVDGSAQVELTGLVPDTTYAVVAETAAGRSAVTRFRTALYPGTSRVVTFGATSCLGGSAWPWESLGYAAAEKLDFFALLGDTVYADGGEGDVAWFRGCYREALATSGLMAVAASTSLVATWDDHEIENDWDGQGGERQQAALIAFRAAVPQRRGETGAIWRTLSWGDTVDLFVLDCRGERDGDRYLSPAQMTWLQDALVASRARFKIIVNSVPITDWSDTVLWDFAQEDRWQGYPDDRAAILGWIRDQGVSGVLWITGDHHFGGITHVDATGGLGESQYEVLCGPAGSSINAASYALPENSRYPSIVRTHNWVRFVCDPDAGTIAVTFVDDDGDAVSTLTLTV